ncbi:hypothetical protein [Streptomyces bobili]|uniref:hypothetical protein n=1 Tax=Streptomyces bobili TaxID=67280 RepID=UPI00371F5CDB
MGQDLSIGYLAHDADSVRLYFQESLSPSVPTKPSYPSPPPSRAGSLKAADGCTYCRWRAKRSGSPRRRAVPPSAFQEVVSHVRPGCRAIVAGRSRKDLLAQWSVLTTLVVPGTNAVGESAGETHDHAPAPAQSHLAEP